MNDTHERLARRAYEVFRADLLLDPSTSLRGGNALDDYEQPPAYDSRVDEPTDEYLKRYAHHGLVYLDPASWRHYLPRLIEYTLRHYRRSDGHTGLVVGGLLASLRPPEREPPRVGSLSADQESVVAEFLEALAFDDDFEWQDEALALLQEYWDRGQLTEALLTT